MMKMSNNFDIVIAALKFLDLKPNIHQYKGRFIIQKTVHLAQALGLKTDYYFTIYVSGPYSPALAHEYYQHSERLASLQTDYELTPQDIQLLENIKKCCDLYEDAFLMEATSTIVYLMKNRPELKEDDVLIQLKWLKPHLNDQIRIIGLTRAKALLFKPKYFTEELKKELEEWEKIDD